MNEALYFYESYQYDVSFSYELDNEKYEFQATLQIEPGKFPVLTSSDKTERFYWHKLPKQIQEIVCFDRGSDRTIRLYDCERYNEEIIPNYIITHFSQDTKPIIKIRCELDGVSQWYCQQSSFSFTGDGPNKLERAKIPSVERKIVIDEKSYLFTVHHNAILRHSIKKNSNVQLEDLAIITLESIDEALEVESIASLLNDLRMLFSLILGYDINIRFVEVVAEDDKRMQYYFPTRKYDHLPIRWYGDYFVSAKSFVELSGKILDHYFNINRKIFLNSWYRFIALFSESHFIEYEYLTYCTILDGYVNEKAKNLQKECNKEEHDAILSDLCCVIESYKNSPDENSLLFQQWLNKIDDKILRMNFPNVSLVTFQDKIKAVLNCYPEEVTNIFVKRSKIGSYLVDRNSITHGRGKSSQLGVLQEKLYTLISLLLLFAFTDLGLTSKEFLTLFYRTQHPIKRKSKYNQEALDRCLETKPFLNVAKKDFDYLVQNKFLDVVLQKKGDQYEFLPEATALLKDWYKNSDGIREVGEFVQQKVITSPSLRAKYVGSPYIVSKRRTHSLFQAVLIEPEN